MGESAKTQEISNFKNTVNSLKRLIGKKLTDPDVEFEKAFLNCELVEQDGTIAAKVNYLGEEKVFTLTQLTAMFLGKLKEITAMETKANVSDVVISVPGYFDDFQRRALLDASEIAGLNCLKLMNELTASALGYGITKTDLPEDKPRNVCFVDIGHSSYSVAVVSFLKGKLEVKSSAFDKHFGGRNFDEAIVNYCIEESKSKYKLDIRSNVKAMFRLRLAAEKTKKILSANVNSSLNVESIMNDMDISFMVSRNQFEEWCEPLLSRVHVPLEEAIQKAGMTVADIDSIEIVGGTTRIPAVKERLAKFFGKELSTTLNQDEAVARGCALQCAVISPAFKVRDFSVMDAAPYSVKMAYDPIPEQPEDCGLEVFGVNSAIPCTKLVTFERRESFEVKMEYEDGRQVGRYVVKNVTSLDGNLVTVKVKARMNPHGIVGVEGAYILQKSESNAEEGKEAKEEKVKVELPIESENGSLSKNVLITYSESESKMIAADKLVSDTLERKNALEEYIYDLRTKIQGTFTDFVEKGEAEKIEKKLMEMEDWLYGEGEDTTKSVYVGKLEELHKLGDPIKQRHFEYEEIPRAEKSLRDVIAQFIAQANSNEEKLAHISTEERNKVLDKCASVADWLNKGIEKNNGLNKWEKMKITSEEIRKEREALVKFATPILTKPKPAPAPVPTPAPTQAQQDQQPAGENGSEQKPDEEMKDSESVPDMELD